MILVADLTSFMQNTLFLPLSVPSTQPWISMTRQQQPPVGLQTVVLHTLFFCVLCCRRVAFNVAAMSNPIETPRSLRLNYPPTASVSMSDKRASRHTSRSLRLAGEYDSFAGIMGKLATGFTVARITSGAKENKPVLANPSFRVCESLQVCRKATK